MTKIDFLFRQVDTTLVWYNVGELTEQSLPSHLEAMLISQSHIFSTNVWHKHQALNWAIVFTIMAVGLLFILGVAYACAIA